MASWSVSPAEARRRYKARMPHFGTREAVRRAKIAALQGELERAERWMKLQAMFEKAAANELARTQAAVRESEMQAYRARMATRLDQRDNR